MKNPALHIHNRLAFGPRPADLDGPVPDLEEYLERQMQPTRIGDSGVDAQLDGLETLSMSGPEILTSSDDRMQQRRGVAQLSQAKLLRAIGSERQLQEVMVDFWFNHFNVFAGKGVCSVLLPSYEREAIRPHVFGRFPDLVHATARHPAMLVYLDNWLSAVPDPRLVRRAGMGMQAPGRRRGLNENYARELMELHTLGVDGGYTQDDVVQVARAFTGWTIEGPRNPVFRFAAALHDSGNKELMGQRIIGSGMEEGESVIDRLAAHPSTARFISTRLARRFVSDDPPAALVDRVARTFMETGGEIRPVLRTLVLSPEFRNSEAGKVKTPLEFVASAFRRIGATPANPNLLTRTLNQMGQRPYGAVPPTGYPDTAQDWMSSGALVARLNLVTLIAAPRAQRLVTGLDARPDEVIRTLGSAEFQRR
jgi:uncharacterized protein (DUF1800 family)